MGDQYDAYREALVIEGETVWPKEGPELDPRTRKALEALVHSQPQLASQLVYVRLFTGFCRRIILSREDIERLLSLLGAEQQAPRKSVVGEGTKQ